jgi:hypothetical protein
MFDHVYKLRHLQADRRRWNAASALLGKQLSVWIREALNERAQKDLAEQQ